MQRPFAGLILLLAPFAVLVSADRAVVAGLESDLDTQQTHVGIMGHVANPRVYDFETSRVSVADVISRAAGALAERFRVRVVRNGRGAWGVPPGSRGSSDAVLRSGDLVILDATQFLPPSESAADDTPPGYIQVGVLHLNETPLIFRAPPQVRTVGQVLDSLRQKRESLESVISVVNPSPRTGAGTQARLLRPFDVLVLKPELTTPETVVPQSLLWAAVGAPRVRVRPSATSVRHKNTYVLSDRTDSADPFGAQNHESAPNYKDLIFLRHGASASQELVAAGASREDFSVSTRTDSQSSQADAAAMLETSPVSDADPAPLNLPAPVNAGEDNSVPDALSAMAAQRAPIPPGGTAVEPSRETIERGVVPLLDPSNPAAKTQPQPPRQPIEAVGVNWVTAIGIASLLAILVFLVAGSFVGPGTQAAQSPISSTPLAIPGRPETDQPSRENVVPSPTSLRYAEPTVHGTMQTERQPAAAAAEAQTSESDDDLCHRGQVLKSLIANQYPISGEKVVLPERLELYGKPAGPRPVRIDAAHEQMTGPHADRPHAPSASPVHDDAESSLRPQVISTAAFDAPQPVEALGLLDRALSRVHGASVR